MNTVPELNLIIVLLKKESYRDSFEYIDKEYIRTNFKELWYIYQSLEALHESVEKDLTLDELQAFFFVKYPEADQSTYGNIFKQLSGVSIDPAVGATILNEISNRKKALVLSEAAFRYSNGTGELDKLTNAITKFGTPTETELDVEFVDTDLEYLLNETVHKRGLRWRLNFLNKALGSLRKGDFGFLFARPECLHPETPVLLYSGKVVQAQEVKVGMSLMGDDSTPRTVMSTTWGKQPMYKVAYPWGESYTVNENHILSLKRSKVEGPHQYGDILNVTVREYLGWPESKKRRYKGWKTGVEFGSQSWHKLDPYFLGLWLGDGTSANQQLTNADPEVIDWLEGYCQALQLKFYKATRASQGKALTISFTDTQGKPNKLRELLREYQLINNKHIPLEYKVASRETRKQVLSGLIDTDGYYDKVHNGYEIATVSKVLCDDILFLARSLGLHATANERPNHYRVGIYGDLSSFPIRIKRKQQVAKATTKRKGLQFGFSIEALGEGDYYGFTLTGNHLFVLGDFTVTHNTGKTTFLASEVSHMLTQLQEDSGPIIWANNEEDGKKVMIRVYQAYFGCTLQELYRNPKHFRERFREETSGKFLLLDDANMHRGRLERAVASLKPSLVVFDQIDKIKGFSNDREDLRLGSIYIWAREIAKAQCPVIGVCQANGTAEGVEYLTMDHVANSATAKQAEADWILGIGKNHKETAEYVRYLNISKNKLQGDSDSLEKLRHGRTQVLIEPTVAHYRDIREYE